MLMLYIICVTDKITLINKRKVAYLCLRSCWYHEVRSVFLTQLLQGMFVWF